VIQQLPANYRPTVIASEHKTRSGFPFMLKFTTERNGVAVNEAPPKLNVRWYEVVLCTRHLQNM
jgi:hypothetical protein